MRVIFKYAGRPSKGAQGGEVAVVAREEELPKTVAEVWAELTEAKAQVEQLCGDLRAATEDYTDEHEKNAQLRGDLDEETKLRERLAELLTQTAAALKGPPPPLTLHDWSDLPAVAARLTKELAEANANLDLIRAAQTEAEIQAVAYPINRGESPGKSLVEENARLEKRLSEVESELATRREHERLYGVPTCHWETYHDGEFDGVCGNARPCPKHDKTKA